VPRESVIDAGAPASFPSGNADTERPTRTRTPLVPPTSYRIERIRRLRAATRLGFGGEQGKKLKELLRRPRPGAIRGLSDPVRTRPKRAGPGAPNCRRWAVREWPPGLSQLGSCPITGGVAAASFRAL